MGATLDSWTTKQIATGARTPVTGTLTRTTHVPLTPDDARPRRVEKGQPEMSEIKPLYERVRDELGRAYRKHGREPWGRHEFYAILLEEVEELWDAIKSDEPQERVVSELVQVAAMCFRYAETGDRYRGEMLAKETSREGNEAASGQQGVSGEVGDRDNPSPVLGPTEGVRPAQAANPPLSDSDAHDEVPMTQHAQRPRVSDERLGQIEASLLEHGSLKPRLQRELARIARDARQALAEAERERDEWQTVATAQLREATRLSKEARTAISGLRRERDQWQAHAARLEEALRATLEIANKWVSTTPAERIAEMRPLVDRALAATPASSLAERDARVRAEQRERDWRACDALKEAIHLKRQTMMGFGEVRARELVNLIDDCITAIQSAADEEVKP